MIWPTTLDLHSSYLPYITLPLLVSGLGLLITPGPGPGTTGLGAGATSAAAAAAVNTMQEVGWSLVTALLNTLTTDHLLHVGLIITAALYRRSVPATDTDAAPVVHTCGSPQVRRPRYETPGPPGLASTPSHSARCGSSARCRTRAPQTPTARPTYE